jgi:hypothetical protein
MRRMHWATYLWPGLPQLWLDGMWSGLALALGAAALVDVLLLSTLVWVELFDAAIVKLGWGAAGLLWVGAGIGAARTRRTTQVLQGSSTNEDLFRRAQSEYLQGDYFQTEATLAELLARNPRDIEGRLLLATMLLRTKRYKEADAQYTQLSKLESASYWHIEVAAERAFLKQIRKNTRNQATNENPNTDGEHLTAVIQLPSTSQAA